MNKQMMAAHLGFSTWERLMKASTLVAGAGNRTWYITKTPTWYQWVLWNSNFDVYFNHPSREAALATLKSLFEAARVTNFSWNVPDDFESIEACFLGIPDTTMSVSPQSFWIG
ncbi:hypothetical protein LLE49_11870 [Alicyclobacillus tolerans]|uniref:hypothetical protein n=1 Tax=Alicyclobacillus tolerans TaxID=90970 RepID=UPI001F251861|nr:hypothetical protein [Alicyclobacillus tolerans]MCF8565414.1 hypothetical protein [Alicyclobacillus tolerans]